MSSQKKSGTKCLHLWILMPYSTQRKQLTFRLNKNTHTSRAKQVQKTSMQAALEEEREALSQTAQRNASRYSEAEDATKNFVIG